MKKHIRKVICWGADQFTNIQISLNRKGEFRKFQDPKRVEIYSQVELTDKQKEEIDKLYVENYGKKIPYIWHRHFTAFTGKFDAEYIPEMIYAPEFERFMCHHIEYAKVFTDKNMLYLLSKAIGIKMPNTYLSATKGVYRDEEFAFIDRSTMLNKMNNLGEVFIKPTVDSSSGVGCFVADFRNGIDCVSKKTSEEILNSLGKDFAIQERLKCHESIRKIYSGSVNTFRIITYIWKNEIIPMPVIMRIGSGGAYLDNAHAGGMFIALDNDGTLHKKAFTEFKREFEEHPDTHIKFEGYKIDLFPDVLKAAIRMHESVPQIGCCNWDFTIDELGTPVMIEANMNNGKVCGSVWLVEMAHGCGPFGDKTKEVLRWLRVMKNTPKSQWNKYEFGELERL